MLNSVLMSEILVKDGKLQAIILEENEHLLEMIKETLQQQEEVLKLKSVDQTSLKMVVQL